MTPKFGNFIVSIIEIVGNKKLYLPYGPHMVKKLVSQPYLVKVNLFISNTSQIFITFLGTPQPNNSFWSVFLTVFRIHLVSYFWRLCNMNKRLKKRKTTSIYIVRACVNYCLQNKTIFICICIRNTKISELCQDPPKKSMTKLFILMTSTRLQHKL